MTSVSAPEPDTPMGVARTEGAPSILEHLEAIRRQYEARESQIQVFIPEPERFARLRAEARELESRFPSRVGRPVLYGVLAGVKDIFHADGFPTRAGSQLPAEELAGDEAVAVTRLKSVGALVMGKTVTTEFAYFAPGPTRNPRNPDHTPGGSSSGSAAAVAAGYCPLALGTQTIGSIIRPAAFCGVRGVKPSYDRIPRAGVIPLAPSVDHVGVFAADLTVMRKAAVVLCEGWAGSQPGGRPVLGIPEGLYLESAEPAGLAQFRQVCRRLESAGYTLRPVAAFPGFGEVVARHNLIVAAEAAQVHRAWFARYPDRYHRKTAELIRSGVGVTERALAEAVAGRIALRNELAELMDAHQVDLWICPSAPGPAPRGLESTGDPVMNLPWTHAGMPALSLPSGVDPDGLPFGLQVVARFHADEKLIAWAQDLLTVLGDPQSALP